MTPSSFKIIQQAAPELTTPESFSTSVYYTPEQSPYTQQFPPLHERDTSPTDVPEYVTKQTGPVVPKHQYAGKLDFTLDNPSNETDKSDNSDKSGYHSCESSKSDIRKYIPPPPGFNKSKTNSKRISENEQKCDKTRLCDVSCDNTNVSTSWAAIAKQSEAKKERSDVTKEFSTSHQTKQSKNNMNELLEKGKDLWPSLGSEYHKKGDGKTEKHSSAAPHDLKTIGKDLMDKPIPESPRSASTDQLIDQVERTSPQFDRTGRIIRKSKPKVDYALYDTESERKEREEYDLEHSTLTDEYIHEDSVTSPNLSEKYNQQTLMGSPVVDWFSMETSPHEHLSSKDTKASHSSSHAKNATPRSSTARDTTASHYSSLSKNNTHESSPTKDTTASIQPHVPTEPIKSASDEKFIEDWWGLEDDDDDDDVDGWDICTGGTDIGSKQQRPGEIPFTDILDHVDKFVRVDNSLKPKVERFVKVGNSLQQESDLDNSEESSSRSWETLSNPSDSQATADGKTSDLGVRKGDLDLGPIGHDLGACKNTLDAEEYPDIITASRAVKKSTPVTQTLVIAPPKKEPKWVPTRSRTCTACGDPNHLVYNCPYSNKHLL